MGCFFPPRRPGLALIIALVGVLGLWPQQSAWADPQPVTLREATVNSFGQPPERKDHRVKPDFKDKDFTPKEAVNYEEVAEIFDGFSPDQEAFLAKHRFLLLPKNDFLMFPPYERTFNDEMLANFDGIGGSVAESRRESWNARFIGPDVVMHAFNKYLAVRLEALESGRLADMTRLLLNGLLENAAQLRKSSSAVSSRNWERLMAQLTVPLILLETSAEAPVYDRIEEETVDTLENALLRLEDYRGHFSTAMLAKIKRELERVYKAQTVAPGLLGLAPEDGGERIDYSWFLPQRHYARQSRGRAYFRAMTWLGRLGWNSRTPDGLADALNCSLAISYEPQPGKKTAAVPAAGETEPPPEATALPSLDLRAVWSYISEVNTFFLGRPEGLSYLDWLPYLMKESGVPEFTVDTAADPVVLDRLAASLVPATLASPHFPDYPRRSTSGVLSIFPRRVDFTTYLTGELTWREGRSEDLPVIFSGLWLPALMGDAYARELIPRQVGLTLGAALETGSEAAGGKNRAERNSASLNGRLDHLAAKFSPEPAEAWLDTLGTAWFRIWSTLAVEYGSGYPQYMRGRAFQAKRLESVMGGFAEWRHDTPAPEKSAVVDQKSGGGGDEPSAELVKGFIEPNLLFWEEMMATVQVLMAGYQQYGLFPEDLEEFGALRRFSKRLERCAALTEKELTGRELTEDDYEFIRLFTLDWMAAPFGGGSTRQPDDQVQSGLVTEAQILGLGQGADERAAVVYEATAEPWCLVVMVGNEKSPRLTIGLAYNHYEFAGPYARLLTDEVWKKVVYGAYLRIPPPGGLRVPPKNFWYEPLRP